MNKDKYLQIFNYLLEFSMLRDKTIRDIELQETQYPEILWLDNIPPCETFENVIREDFNPDNEYWIKVRKPKVPEKPLFPKISENLQNWIEPLSLIKEEGEPIIKDTLSVNDKTLSINEFPEIQEEFIKYVNEKWVDDLIDYKNQYSEYEKKYSNYELQNNVFKQLFRIYNKAQLFSEEYELIIGVGLLNYKEATDKPRILRHLITQRVEVNIESSKRDTHIIIGPNMASLPQVETDFIRDLPDQFNPQLINNAEKETEKCIKEKEIDYLFSNGLIKEALQIFADLFSEDGEFIEEIKRPNYTASNPTLFYSPALLLRKRNTKSLTTLYKRIIENIETDSKEIRIPSIDDLEIESNKGKEKLISEISKQNITIEPVYFPKEANDEQREIVYRTRYNNKILVQGPPGTGKSHTIANMICHLLANGNKILITAQTKRALEVLKGQLPDEFQNLAVNLLSNDSTSIQDLQVSVNAINDELSKANVNDYKSTIEQLEKELSETKERIASTKHELVKIKESATRKLKINPNYYGTLAEIAEKLDCESNQFNWYPDSFCDFYNVEIINELRSFIELNKFYMGMDISKFISHLPKIDILPTAEKVRFYKSYIDKYNSLPRNNEIQTILCNDHDKLKNMFFELVDYYKQLDGISIDFKQKLISSYFQGNSNQWYKKIELSASILSRIHKNNLQQLQRDIRVSYNVNKDIIDLKGDAKKLLAFLKQGNLLSGVQFNLKKAFLPKEIKDRLYFIEKVLVNGNPCDTIKEFEDVISDIELKQDFQELAEIWETDIIPKSSSYSRKVTFFGNIHSTVTEIIDILKKTMNLISEIESYAHLKIIPFDISQVNDLILKSEYNIIFKIVEEYKEKVKEVDFISNEVDYHPITKEILSALKQNDCYSYEQKLLELNALVEEKNKYQSFITKEKELKKILPNLIEKIASGELILENLSVFEEAIKFKHAKNEVNKLTDINYEKKLFEGLKELERKEKKLIAKLASKKAWSLVYKNLDENINLKRHLNAFAVFATKARGKGKRALKFQKDVQEQMKKCKDSIPCWIMDLNKVTESIYPEQEMFDYIIIDEASQLGPDAIFLLYISKNIIVVGDDKQIAPENVGVTSEQMTPYIERFLSEFTYKNCFQPDFSFFDFAKVFCEKPIVLREHFRCMPEIIEFSNKYFYRPERKELFPLKQYSTKRLDPLRSVVCKNGYIEGSGSTIINKPEAELIAETINKLIKKDEYYYFDEKGKRKPKTIGVISLQGSHQAAHIDKLLLEKINDQEYRQRKILCGDSASFQGDERDIIFLSLVTGDRHQRRALTSLTDERRFNVAMSRAKEQMWLFHSVELEDLSNNDLRYKVLNHFVNPDSDPLPQSEPINRKLGNQPEPFDSWFEVDIFNDIVAKGFHVTPQYKVARGRYIIDLVVNLNNGTRLAIECDGSNWHGPEQYFKDLDRQKQLERCGWQFFRVKDYLYYANREEALMPLWETIAHLEAVKDVQIGKISIVGDTESSTVSNLSSNINENVESSGKKAEFSHKIEVSSVEQESTQIIRYFNLYCSGIYILSHENPLDADYVIPIKSNQRSGYLLQCYESGHINKVLISILLSRKIGKEYLNGLNTNDKLIKVTVIEAEKIIGIYFTENGERKFKAHLTENISCREQLHLQGYKVIYNDYEQIEYKILPLEIKEDINRLVFNSFTANGKPISNNYYDKEWAILKRFTSKAVVASTSNTKGDNFLILEKEPAKTNTIFDKKVTINSTVKIKYINKGNEVTIHLVDYETKGFEVNKGIQNVYNKSKLGTSIIGASVGDKVKIINTDFYVKIIDII